MPSLKALATGLLLAVSGAHAGGDHDGDAGHGHDHEHGQGMEATQDAGHAHGQGGAAPETERAKATQDGHFFVAYRPVPDPVPVNRLFRLRVDVYASAERQRSIEQAEVSVLADMPDHGHGMNTAPEVTPRGDGGYLVEGMKFHMPGTAAAPWRIKVTVQAGNQTDSATFHVVNGH